MQFAPVFLVPNIVHVPGPHSIPLIVHAEKGGSGAKAVLEFCGRSLANRLHERRDRIVLSPGENLFERACVTRQPAGKFAHILTSFRSTFGIHPISSV